MTWKVLILIDPHAVLDASCHCGLVRFEVRKGKPIDTLTECNCSICTKKGIVHTPAEDDEMVIFSGEDGLAVYQFGTKVARYTFCPRCGCSAFYRSRGVGTTQPLLKRILGPQTGVQVHTPPHFQLRTTAFARTALGNRTHPPLLNSPGSTLFSLENQLVFPGGTGDVLGRCIAAMGG